MAKITSDRLSDFVSHVYGFLPMVKDKHVVFRHQLEERSHTGDDGLCPNLENSKEAVFVRHLQKDYNHRTPDQHPENQSLTRCSIITMHDAEDLLQLHQEQQNLVAK